MSLSGHHQDVSLSTTTSTSNAPDGPLCVRCKDKSREGQKVSKYCECFYHLDCLRQLVSSQQQTTCPVCSKPFSNCCISKHRKSFGRFLCTSEVCTMLVVALLLYFYLIYFLLIVFTQYGILHADHQYPLAVELWLIVPGFIFAAFSAIVGLMGVFHLKHRYKLWTTQNFTLRVSDSKS
ncbi:hypothetical protein TYRP_007151 [Tyrophagus putrescentiae]|nr:hypothetical protein TYRP_007151 [Tyrophagus putrescentiae]